MANVVGNWEGGRIVQKADGTNVYYIRKDVAGKSYDISTRATKLRAALAHYARFQENPEAYKASGELPHGNITVGSHMHAYLLWCKNKVRPNSPEWIASKRRDLLFWSRALPGDVRRFTRNSILGAIKDEAGYQHNRVAALKAYCTYLRNVLGLLERSEDATLDIAIPVAKRKKWGAKPRAISKEVWAATLPHIAEGWACVAELQAGTGMHTREANRLARGMGSIEGDTLTIFHKDQDQHRMKVTPEVAAAAVKVMARGAFNVSRYATAIKEACEKARAENAKVEDWAPGCLRHSYISWKVAEGVPLNVIADYTNHDLETLKRFYNEAAIPVPRP